jgi:ferric-dicitrate binding protein FerR (iron transport regulator)
MCIAAASLFAIILYSSLEKNQHSIPKQLASLNEIVTKKGSKTNIKLPDGTKVWLNADSKIVYAEKFIGSTREVTLIGEAYFDVVHDSIHPFIIHTGKEDIKVLGTAFNVRNYPSEKMLETTLMRGKIEVTFKGRPDEKIVLKPLEKLIVSKESYTVVNAVNRPNSTQVPENKITLTSATYFTQKDSMVVETAWVNDRMVFINQPLEKIAEELERNFGITVIFKSDIVKEYRYTGVFDNQSLDKVLEIIKLSRKIDYRIIDKKLIIE